MVGVLGRQGIPQRGLGVAIQLREGSARRGEGPTIEKRPGQLSGKNRIVDIGVQGVRSEGHWGLGTNGGVGGEGQRALCRSGGVERLEEQEAAEPLMVTAWDWESGCPWESLD